MIKYIEKSAPKNRHWRWLWKSWELERDTSQSGAQLPRSGFLGIGSSPAVLRIGYEAPDEPEEPVVEAEEKPVEPSEPKAEKKPAPRREAKKEKAAPKKSAAPEEVKREIKDYGDENKNRIARFLEGLLDRMGNYKNIAIDIEDSPRGIAVTLSGKGIGSIIGHRGETLDAIQHLTSFVVNNNVEERVPHNHRCGGLQENVSKAL